MYSVGFNHIYIYNIYIFCNYEHSFPDINFTLLKIASAVVKGVYCSRTSMTGRQGAALRTQAYADTRVYMHSVHPTPLKSCTSTRQQ